MAIRRLAHSFLQDSLLRIAPRTHDRSDSTLRRRQVITLVTVVIGAIVLAISLRIEPGSRWFYPSSIALAAVWTIGAFASGPLHLGRISTSGGSLRRPVLHPLLWGLAMAAVFSLGALAVRPIDPLADQVANVLQFATEGSLMFLVVITVANGVAEELFFRGAAYAAITRHPVAWTTLGYTVATAATGNIMLAFAASILGLLTGLQRRASGGILAPAITHCTWSLSMLLVLPAIFGLR